MGTAMPICAASGFQDFCPCSQAIEVCGVAQRAIAAAACRFPEDAQLLQHADRPYRNRPPGRRAWTWKPMSSRWCWKRPTSRERGPRGIRGAESMSRPTRHPQQTCVEARTRLRDARVDPSRGRSGAAKLHGLRRGPCAAAPAHGSGRGSAAGPQLLSISHGEPESVSESVTLGRV
jgi:hypothetical protein